MTEQPIESKKEVTEEKKEENKTDVIMPGDVDKSWIGEAIQYLATPKDKRYPATVVDFCEKIGIARSVFYYEVEKPEFQQRLLKRMLSTVKEHAPEVLDKLVQNAKEGETKAIEIFMKYVLEIAEKIDHTGEVQGKGFTLNIIQANKNEGGKLDTDKQAK